MKKENIIAAIVGAIVGLILAIILLSRNNTKESKILLQENNKPTRNIPKVNKEVSPIKGIKILSPSSQSIVKENKIKLKLEVPKDSLIIVTSPVFEKAIFAKKEKIELEVKLALGENRIKIYSYPTDPALVNLEDGIVVYYIERKI